MSRANSASSWQTLTDPLARSSRVLLDLLPAVGRLDLMRPHRHRVLVLEHGFHAGHRRLHPVDLCAFARFRLFRLVVY